MGMMEGRKKLNNVMKIRNPTHQINKFLAANDNGFADLYVG
jgi:hypothetical protein